MTGRRGAALYERLTGVYSIFLTPLTPDLRIDLDAAEENADFLIRHGVNGLVVAGIYGEYFTLTSAERIDLLRRVVRSAVGRVPVVACTSGGSTAEVIAETRRAEEAGADGAMITPPYGVIEPTEAGIIGHFEAVARGTGTALLLYNNPNLVPGLGPELLARLAEIDGYVGIKQGAVTIGEYAELIPRRRPPAGVQRIGPVHGRVARPRSGRRELDAVQLHSGDHPRDL